MKVLVVVAHPDDEVLGMGGTLLKHQSRGDEIYIHILTDGLYSRLKDNSRVNAAKQVTLKLNITELKIDNFKDQMLDTYSITEIISSIEKFGVNISPDFIYTHFPGDLNRDHQIVYQAVLTAFRPITSKSPMRILCTEVPSSTEWGITNFNPNYFVNISDQLEQKIELVKLYLEELREFPHPRSIENIVLTAKKWGCFIHTDAAEAFVIHRETWK